MLTLAWPAANNAKQRHHDQQRSQAELEAGRFHPRIVARRRQPKQEIVWRGCDTGAGVIEGLSREKGLALPPRPNHKPDNRGDKRPSQDGYQRLGKSEAE
jgi:hypothetical protein